MARAVVPRKTAQQQEAIIADEEIQIDDTEQPQFDDAHETSGTTAFEDDQLHVEGSSSTTTPQSGYVPLAVPDESSFYR